MKFREFKKIKHIFSCCNKYGYQLEMTQTGFYELKYKNDLVFKTTRINEVSVFFLGYVFNSDNTKGINNTIKAQE